MISRYIYENCDTFTRTVTVVQVMAEISIFQGSDSFWEKLHNCTHGTKRERQIGGAGWVINIHCGSRELTVDFEKNTVITCCAKPDCRTLSSEWWGYRAVGWEGFLHEVWQWSRLVWNQQLQGGGFCSGGHMSPLTDCKKEPVCDSLHNSVLIISLKAIFNL